MCKCTRQQTNSEYAYSFSKFVGCNSLYYIIRVYASATVKIASLHSACKEKKPCLQLQLQLQLLDEESAFECVLFSAFSSSSVVLTAMREKGREKELGSCCCVLRAMHGVRFALLQSEGMHFLIAIDVQKIFKKLFFPSYAPESFSGCSKDF